VADDQVCGSCHSRGTSPEGYNFPASYHPGDTLTDHFTFATEEDYFWPDGSAKSNHQQYMDWTSGNTMASSGDIGCTTCHLVHETGEVQAQLQQPTNDLCLECHNEQRALVKHTPFHEQALRQHSFTCANCHMPLIATSAVPFDLHTHAFAQPNPSASIEHGGVDMMPNSCNLCHQELAETPEWAQETIHFSRGLAPQTSFFGPGPTPTSPPPPTPMASVGEAPEEIEIEPPFGWLRSAVFIAGGLLVVVAIAGIANYMYRRRKLNA
jgi:predicted CXXCH cytochrome family protein